MSGFVQSSKDEKIWDKAKKIAKDKALSGDDFYAYANAIFHRMKGREELDESLYNISEDRLKLYKQLDYPINSIDEEESWHTMKYILENHPNFNGELEESDQYEAFDYLFDNYKKTINKNDFDSIKNYLNDMLVPKARVKRKDKDIEYGVLEEDYISGGFGGLGAAEYGYGGVGYAGGRGRRRGFGGPRQGGGMSRRATANPWGRPGRRQENPIVVDVTSPDEKPSNYKPWQVELTPQGDQVKNVKRNQIQSTIDQAWDSELGEVLRGLENLGLDYEEMADMTQEEIEDIMIRKLRSLGQDQEDLVLQETVKKTKNISNKILEAFGVEETLEEKIKRSSRIQDAREILASKHQVSDAIEKKKDRSYVIDRYGIEKLMRKYGYIFDVLTKKWIKSEEGKNPNKKDDEKDESEEDKAKDDGQENGINIDAAFADSQEYDKTDENGESKFKPEPDKDDFDHFKKVNSAVQLETKLKPLQARYLLAISRDEPENTKFSVDKDKIVFKPKISDEKILEKVKNLGWVWNSDKDIWLDETNTIPEKAFKVGETRQSLMARSYLAAMDDLSAIQFTRSREPIITAEEANSMLKNRGYVFDKEINKWLFNDKDLAGGAQNLQESVILNEQKSPKKVATIDQQEELQARYIYRLVQLKALKDAPEYQRKVIEIIVNDQNPILYDKNLTPVGDLSNEEIVSILSGEIETDKDKKDEKELSRKFILKHLGKKGKQEESFSFKNAIHSLFEQDDEEQIEVGGEDEEDEDVKVSGEEDEEKVEKEKIPISEDDKILPRTPLKFDEQKNIWTKNGEIPDIVKEVGDDIKSLTGRVVLSVRSDDPKYVQVNNKGKPLVFPQRVLSVLERNEEINWSDEHGWIIGQVPEEDEIQDVDELTPEEKELKKEHLIILRRYNNGKGFDADNMKPREVNRLINAIAARYVIEGGVTEKEFYNVPENPRDKVQADMKRQQLVKRFQKKNKMQLKKIPLRDRKSPGKSHFISVKPRRQLRKDVAKLGLTALAGILSKGIGKTIQLGLAAAAAADGYQGPDPYEQLAKIGKDIRDSITPRRGAGVVPRSPLRREPETSPDIQTPGRFERIGREFRS